MNMHIAELSGSKRNPKSTLNAPAGIHVNSVWVSTRSSPGSG